MLRILRIAVLLYILAWVAVGTLVESSEATNWDYALRVLVYPVSGDSTAAVSDYVDTLSSADFDAVESFLASEARRYSLALERPVEISLAAERNVTLPPLARRPSSLDILIWSLRMRWLRFVLDWHSDQPSPDITVFAVYHDSATRTVLDGSTALRKGLIAIANVYADQRQRGGNNIVITHELLHTLGASDKYDLQTLQPAYPNGYIEPKAEPLHPQRFAEIMAGRRALSSHEAEMPASLRSVRVGAATALEIGWLD